MNSETEIYLIKFNLNLIYLKHIQHRHLHCHLPWILKIWYLHQRYLHVLEIFREKKNILSFVLIWENKFPFGGRRVRSTYHQEKSRIQIYSDIKKYLPSASVDHVVFRWKLVKSIILSINFS